MGCIELDKIQDPLACRILDRASDLEGLTQAECQELGMDRGRCHLMQKALGGTITEEVATELTSNGISPQLVRDLRGEDGARALRNRVHWLTEHAKYGLEKRKVDLLPGRSLDETIDEHIRNLGVYADYQLRKKAQHELVQLGRLAVPKLIKALDNPNVNIQEDVPEFLAKIGPVTPDVIPALIDKLAEANTPGLAAGAASLALKEIGICAKRALIQAAKGDNIARRRMAVVTLAELSSITEDVVDTFIEILLAKRFPKNNYEIRDEAGARMSAARGLATIDPSSPLVEKGAKALAQYLAEHPLVPPTNIDDKGLTMDNAPAALVYEREENNTIAYVSEMLKKMSK